MSLPRAGHWIGRVTQIAACHQPAGPRGGPRCRPCPAEPEPPGGGPRRVTTRVNATARVPIPVSAICGASAAHCAKAQVAVATSGATNLPTAPASAFAVSAWPVLCGSPRLAK
ncbi:hypothetical protein GCM10023321_70100 [Pseudonocardia eucalypti]|uniref:Uncharacterized protein n=1 Tax=Pseudonocardia eucalypti TaxID=648755 RepID=A0ABP9R5U1_9PSEU